MVPVGWRFNPSEDGRFAPDFLFYVSEKNRVVDQNGLQPKWASATWCEPDQGEGLYLFTGVTRTPVGKAKATPTAG